MNFFNEMKVNGVTIRLSIMSILVLGECNISFEIRKEICILLINCKGWQYILLYIILWVFLQILKLYRWKRNYLLQLGLTGNSFQNNNTNPNKKQSNATWSVTSLNYHTLSFQYMHSRTVQDFTINLIRIKKYFK